MNIKIRATNFELTPAIEQYVHKKISSLQKFLGGSDVLCEVEIGRTSKHHKSGDIFRAEINIVRPGSGQVFASAEESDLYTAVDIVRDEADRLIVSGKKRRLAMLRRGAIRVKNLLKRISGYRRYRG